MGVLTNMPLCAGGNQGTTLNVILRDSIYPLYCKIGPVLELANWSRLAGQPVSGALLSLLPRAGITVRGIFPWVLGIGLGSVCTVQSHPHAPSSPLLQKGEKSALPFRRRLSSLITKDTLA